MKIRAKEMRRKVSQAGNLKAPYRQPCKLAQGAKVCTRKLAQGAKVYTRKLAQDVKVYTAKLAQRAKVYTRKLASWTHREPRRMVRGAAAALLRATPPPSLSLTFSRSLSLSLSPLSLGALAARAMCLLCRLFESARRARRTHHVITYYPATPCRRRFRASRTHTYAHTYYNTRA